MPHPARFGITSQMGRGPYEKSGLIRDTGLPPLRPVRESFEIVFPFEDTPDGVRKLIVDTLEIEIRLLYLPYGVRNQDHFVWYLTKRQVTVE